MPLNINLKVSVFVAFQFCQEGNFPEMFVDFSQTWGIMSSFLGSSGNYWNSLQFSRSHSSRKGINMNFSYEVAMVTLECTD